MRPILFNKNEQSFDTYGLGELNVTKGTVTRERNGNYTLYAEIPTNDPATASLEKEMKLKADAGLRTKNQTFEISRIVKDSSNIVKIYGQHISHKLEYMVLRNATAFSGTAYNALAIWKGALIGDLTFDVWSDIQTSNKGMFDISKMENARLALGGVEGSILDLYGGEYEFDNMTIRLHKQLGRTAPTVLEYGRNILSAESDETIESSYTSVLPFATYTPDKPEGDTSDSQPDPVTVTLPENYVDSKYKALYAHRRIKVVDFSSEFKSDSKSKDIPTPDKLRKLATDYMEHNAIGKPKINIKIEYADLAKTLDYADNGWIEELELCDIVPIYYPQIGLTDETAKVTTITYDFINERNESVEFGDIGTNVRSTMQSGLAGKVDDIAKAQQNFENSLPDYLLNAQGNKVWYNRPSENTEHKVGDIWFEKNGLYNRMYIWNGSQWEKRIDTEDVDNVKKEVNRQLEEAKTTTDRAIAEAKKQADEALKKAGTLPDTSKLSDQIKQQILSSQDLTQKVTESIKSVDGDTIYNKVYRRIEQSFAPMSYANNINNRLSDAQERVNGLDRRIANQTLEFNKLTESNKLYERILGTSETGAPDKLSRLVMSSEIFQTEVGKYSTTGGPNMLRNSRADDGLKYWSEANGRLSFMAHEYYLNGQKKMFLLSSGSFVHSPRFIVKRNTNYMLNLTAFDANTKFFRIVFRKRKKGSMSDYEDFDIIFSRFDVSPAFSSNRAIRKSFSFNTGDFDEGYLEFQYDGNPTGWSGLFMTELDFYEGTNDRKWQPAPEDSSDALGTTLGAKVDEAKILAGDAKTLAGQASNTANTAKQSALSAQAIAESVRTKSEAVRTQVTQLAGSWAVRNLNSAGDVIGQINLNKDGSVKINEGLLVIGEKTIIKNGVIKDGMIESLGAGKITAGTIDANDVNIVNLNAKSVTSGTFRGLTFEGGIIRGNYGNTVIDLNSNVTTYNGTAKIEFMSPQNSLEFNSGGRKAFLSPTISNGTNYAAFAFGVNDRGVMDPNANFTGLKIFNQYGHRKVVLIGDVHIVKDSVSNNAPSTSLADIFRYINENFKALQRFRDQNGEGYPGFYDISL